MKNRIRSPLAGSFSYVARIKEGIYNEYKKHDRIRCRMKRVNGEKENEAEKHTNRCRRY